ncbi:unnamed protein product [Oikopleura dioica]|uniref:Uncharacterized protein n=1 Tax=Oikopleura dioica TaxID=34765 RepID=E4XXL0_OIKDI|nr:unnamed protein product [Oikopleura dioica]
MSRNMISHLNFCMNQAVIPVVTCASLSRVQNIFLERSDEVTSEKINDAEWKSRASFEKIFAVLF